MHKDTFEYIWKQGIAKSAQDVYQEIDPSLRDKYSVSIDISESMCSKLHDEYDAIRLQVREKYFDTGESDENKIDGHKICACITGALLNVRIISYKTLDGEMPVKIVFANYAVAFLAAIYVMYLFLLSDFEHDGKIECYNKLKDKATFVFPKTNSGHDSYVQGRVKTLALNDMYGNDFDILSYADMLFWIERYNKELIYNELQLKYD